MTNVFWYCPLEWPKEVGFHKPTANPASSSSRRASNPRLDQGGMVETLMEGIWQTAEMASEPFTPQSHFDVVGSLRLRLCEPDHPRPDVIRKRIAIGAAGRSPLRTRGSRTCLWHLLAPPLGGGGRLTPTTLGARLSSLTSFLRALEEGRCAAVHLTRDAYVAGSAGGPAWATTRPREGTLT